MIDEWSTVPPSHTLTDAVARTASATPARLSIRVVAGPDEGRVLSLEAGEHTIGKRNECRLILTDPKVSREHVMIVVDEHGARVRDLGSKNGVYVGAMRVSELPLYEGVRFRIGATTLIAEALRTKGARVRDHLGPLIGASAAMQAVYDLIERVSATPVTVLIEGETGSGKELCARAIHDSSARPGALVVCDLGATSRSLLESELFGHVRGAFTGASGDRTGAVVHAHRGTLFLDEIGELEASLQPRLLRVLEEHKVKPVGASRYVASDVRVIAATNRDLAAEVRAGRFREDLFHRLAVVRLRLPPLRERKADIPLLVRSMVSAEMELPPETIALLRSHNWPGNVRELSNVVTRALAALAPGEAMLAPHSLAIGEGSGTHDLSLSFQEAKERLVGGWERIWLTMLLERHRGNVSRAATAGGLTRIHLHRLIKKHGLRTR